MESLPNTIILIEDNPNDAELAMRVLSHCTDRRVVILRDGEEAVNYFFGNNHEQNPDFPSVIFLDLKLPKLHGLEVLKKLRADDRLKVIPIVVLTSSNEENDVLASYQLGANSYVVKPIEYADFKVALTETCDYWLKRNESAVAAQ